MPATIACRALQYSFPARSELALADISFTLPPGSWTLLVGKSGAGKSTLLHALAGLLNEEQSISRRGLVEIDHRDPQRLPAAERAALVGLVQQSADLQICTTTVEAEVAFGLENLALDAREIDARIIEALDFVDLGEQRHRRVTELSGGQRQRLVLAAVLAMRPSVLLLDEPLSQLDPGAAAQFLAVLDRLRHGGPTIVVADHRFAAWNTRADQLLVLDGGRLAAQVPCADRTAWNAALDALRVSVSPRSATPTSVGTTVAQVERLSFAFDRRHPPVLNDVNMSLRSGEQVAILGANGSGKSTLLALLAGLYQPSSGVIRFPATIAAAAVGLVQQNPDALLFCRTVREELEFAPRHARCGENEIARRIDDAARRFDLWELLDRPSILLSQGERLRVAVAATFTLHAPLLLLDEPTTGQDPWREAQLMQSLTDYVGAGGPPSALVFSTQDLHVARTYADRAIVLDNGRIVADEAPGPAIAAYARSLHLEESPGTAS